MIIDEITLSCAFRYALGRRTYVVSSVVDDILDNWNSISKMTKSRFVKEIEKFREDFGLAGMQMDDDQWQRVIDKFNTD